MKLDPRIKSLSDILTCFDIERAKEFIGQKGFFANALCSYNDLSHCCYDTLECVFNRGGDTFRMEGGNTGLAYFIPESSLRPAEKKWRPFANTEEFFKKTNFTECDLIYIRSKINNYEYHLILTGWTDEDLMLGNFSSLSFNELFQGFELWDGDEDKFIPFGVKE